MSTHNQNLIEKIKELLPEKKEEIIIEDCENCGEKGYGKIWYGRGRETGDSYGDRYEPLGSAVLCEQCFKDFKLGTEWLGEEIWKRTSELNYIKKKETKNIGYNQALSDIDPQKLLSVIITEIKKDVEEKVHTNIHKSLNWGMESEEKVIHYSDILALLDNLTKNENK